MTFIVGLILGTLFGVGIMCLMSAAKHADEKIQPTEEATGCGIENHCFTAHPEEK